jgi:biofilm PGA synthesis N-glycosyltransferase PgaC
MSALSFLSSLDLVSFVLFFWYTTLLEIPRYAIGAVIVAGVTVWSRPHRRPDPGSTMSVLLVGHNEAHALRMCVASLNEQTIASTPGRLQIVVVDDGSTDGMSEVAGKLQQEGKIHDLFRLHHRGGKSAGVNLAIGAARGDIVIIIDIDTTFDRDAFEVILGYFADPSVGAVGGSLGVRNASTNLVTRHQAIEYAIGISLGRRIADALGILAIVSGAFGAFRRVAIESVGRQDVEVGEDADLTMKLRRAGWQIRFAPDARALTDVPETISGLIAQRLRWDRGLVTIWGRKYRESLDPRQSTFRLRDVMALVDVVGFQIVLALLFPLYLVWLIYHFGDFTVTVIGATLVGYVVLDVLAFASAAAIGIGRSLRLLPYLPFYTLMQISLMRAVRIIAIVQELIFRSSYRDSYVPERVMRVAERV